jgi:predicted nucleic acid-binding protein
MEKLFVDTDIALDLLAQREPHYEYAARLFTMSDQGKIKLFVSSLSFNNLDYLLSKSYNRNESRRILLQFSILVNILPVNEKTIELALSSSFSDFEDAIQYYTALENKVSILLTRNLRDYKLADMSVMTAESYIKKLKAL